VRDDEAACWPRTIVVSAEASRASVPKAAEPTDTNGSADYLPHPLSASDLEVMRRLNRRHLPFPFGFFYQAVVLVASVESPTVNDQYVWHQRAIPASAGADIGGEFGSTTTRVPTVTRL
jgi:hypothetical protein